MTSTPVLRQQATALQLVAPAGAAVTWRFVLTLPEDVDAVTDARFWTYDEDVPTASVFLDDTLPIIVVSWTAEETTECPLRTGRYVLMVSIDDAPLAPLIGGFLSWIELAQAGTSTVATVNVDAHVGDNVINVTATFAGPEGPPTADAVIGDGITRIEAISQAAYDLLAPPNPTTLYVITS